MENVPSKPSWAPETPYLAVDLVIYYPQRERFVVIERKNPPLGVALPGGFVDRGEDVYAAAVREAKEETGLEVEIDRLIGIYSDPKRDPRMHVASAAFIAHPLDPNALPVGKDDAKKAWLVKVSEIHQATWCFDHELIASTAAGILLSR